MSVLVSQETRLIVQGITGKHGLYHAKGCRDYGTQVVGGVSPGKGGTTVEGFPVFDTVLAARAETGANATMIFVPPMGASDAILEALDAGIELIVCITEGIPVLDMVKVKRVLSDYPKSRLVGPNGPGIISPGKAKIGIMPGHIHLPGNVGVVSRSGTPHLRGRGAAHGPGHRPVHLRRGSGGTPSTAAPSWTSWSSSTRIPIPMPWCSSARSAGARRRRWPPTPRSA